MPRDYKDRIKTGYRPRSRRRRGTPWGAIALAVLALAGAGAIAYKALSGKSGAPENASPPAPAEKQGTVAPLPAGKEAVSAPTKGEEPLKPVQPRFSFYKILPEKEVIIPDSEIHTMRREEDQGKKAETGQYLVQAGSFTQQQDAENLRARLAEIKVKARLELIKLDNAAWYRVKIGPYGTLADAEKVRQYLRANKIDSVLQKAAK